MAAPAKRELAAKNAHAVASTNVIPALHEPPIGGVSPCGGAYRCPCDVDVAPANTVRHNVRSGEVDMAVQHAGVGSGEIGDLPIATSEPPDVVQLAERALRTAIGIASLTTGAIARALTAGLDDGERPAVDLPRDDEVPPAQVLLVAGGAGLAVALRAIKAGLRATSTVNRTVRPWVSFATGSRVVRGGLDRTRRWLTQLDDTWHAEQTTDEALASTFLEEFVPRLVDATLDHLPLTELVVARVDLDRVVETVDVEQVIARIDLDGIASRIDLETIVRRLDLAPIVGGVLDRLDLASVAKNVIDQLDLAAIARDVIDEIDLPQIVRESTGTMANETVEGIRVQGMTADRAVASLVDRLLGRNGSRGNPGAGA